MAERRNVERRPKVGSIQYAVTVVEFGGHKKMNLEGEVVDINNVGIGIKTDYPLEPGHVLTFGGSMGCQTGIVAWSSREQHGYRVGIRFV
jgi:hypothetical protein